MKRWLIWVFFTSIPFYALGVVSDNEALQKRIEPLGQLNILGASIQASSSQVVTFTAEELYDSVCAMCHAGGASGAPRVGSHSDFAPRISQGMTTLLHHALNGYGFMPPKGGCENCTDAQIEAAIRYMLEKTP